MEVFPSIRDSKILKPGISLIKSTSDPKLIEVLDEIWDKFNINFVLNINREKTDGIESFGFGVRVKAPKIDERFINELPLIYKFIDAFLRRKPKTYPYCL